MVNELLSLANVIVRKKVSNYEREVSPEYVEVVSLSEIAAAELLVNIFVKNIVIAVKKLLHKLLQNLLGCDFIYDAESVYPLKLLVNFLKSPDPVGGEHQFVVISIGLHVIVIALLSQGS